MRKILTVVTALMIILVLLGCSALRGPEPMLTVTWSVDYSGQDAHTDALTGQSADRITAVLRQIIADGQGWQQRDLIKLEQVKDPSGGQIIIRPIKRYETQLKCKLIGAAGCAGGNLPFNGAGSCKAYFSQSLFEPDQHDKAVATINHEFGHCFLGGDHTVSGLMSDTVSTSDPAMYPSLHEVIQAIRNQRTAPTPAGLAP